MSNEVPALEFNEEVWGVIQCNHCGYWGRQTGWIEFKDPKYIKFVCPECESVEKVINPEAI